GSGSTTGAAATGFAVLTRRGGGRAGAAGFTGSGAVFVGGGGGVRARRRGRVFGGRRLLALGGRRLGENVPARQLDVALFRESIDELPRHHFLDCARSALDLDAMIALQKRCHFLARGAEQFRDLENTHSCQTR